jgi:GAF domain-containing protein
MRRADVYGVRRTQRVADVARLGLDREMRRPYLHDIVTSVADRLETPFVVIDVLLDAAQVFLDGVGPMPAWMADAGGTPVEWSYCRPLVHAREPLCLPDLAADPVTRDNPLFDLAGVRSWVGAPLISHAGQVLGGLCGLDVRTRDFSASDLAFLQEMADETVDRIEENAESV